MELLRYFHVSELAKAVNASPPATGDDFLIYSSDAVCSTSAKESELKL